MIDANPHYTDLAHVMALPRLTGMALSPDGTRLIVSLQQPDAKGARYVSSLWEMPVDGGAPSRLTHSPDGETSPAFLPDGSLLFLAKPSDGAESGDGDMDGAEKALWLLPVGGHPRMVARRPGGLGAPVVAAESGAVVMSGSRLMYSGENDDAERRATLKERKIAAILHTGMPIRYWDHELGAESRRLLYLGVSGGETVDLAADVTTELIENEYSVSADGSTVATDWRPRAGHGRVSYGVAVIDVATSRRTIVASEPGWEFAGARIAPDGARLAMEQTSEATFETGPYRTLVLVTPGGGDPIPVELDGLYPTEWSWSADSRTLWVSGDWRGRGAVLAVDPATGAVRSRLADDAVYSALCPSPEGDYVYALRSTIDQPMTPVRLRADLASADIEDQAPTRLATPAALPRPPGRLEEVEVDVDGARVRGWLCLPAESGAPVPLMQWIHGGPFMSYNSWSWRWLPWLAVARGWAVLMPDPALSTGYGTDFIERAWPYQARLVWRDIEALLDSVVARPDIDEERTACLGASFGGYMTNWIAGHTDRFKAIVTHAGLWALDQQHATTDAAPFKTGIFGTLSEHPDWYAENSPHNTADQIVTPMLVVHGNRDYRVPVSEALRLWWDLVSRHGGEADSMPHRFLQLTGENHWVLSPANAEIWWDAVLGFCGQHVLDQTWTPSELL